MAINRMTVFKASSDASYRRGLDIFLIDKRITDFEIDINPITGTPMITAAVSDSDGTTHEAGVSIDEDAGEIIGSYCSCSEYAETEGLCCHCVAILLKYISRRHIQMVQRQHSNPAAKTTQKIIEAYIQRDIHRQPETESYGLIELEPMLHQEYHGLSVDFRIGASKKYVVKDLTELVRLVRNHEYFEYGKNLKFYHDPEIFSADSRPFLDFIMQRVDEYNCHFQYIQDSSYIYRTAGPMRRLPLSPAATDSLLRLLCGQKVPYENNKRKSIIQIIEGNPPLNMTLAPRGNSSYTLSADTCHVINGEKNLWLLKDSVLYGCTPAFAADMQIFLKQLELQQTDTLLLPENQMMSFYGNVLKRISPHIQLDTSQVDMSAFMPPEARFSIYLDSPQENSLSCTALVHYGETEISLNTPITLQSGYRDADREYRVLAAIRTWFKETTEENQAAGDFIIDNDEQAIFLFLEQGLPLFYRLGDVYIPESMKNMRIIPSPKASVGVSIASGLLELDIQSGDLPYDELAGILNSYRRRRKYYKLKSGEFLRLENNSLSVLAELADGLHLTDRDIRQGKINLPLHRSAYVDAVLTEHNTDIRTQRDRHFKSLIRELKSVADSDYEIPGHLKSVLRDYQKTGYRWLQTISHLGFGGILADDMGLGKTLQIITLLAAYKAEYTPDSEGAGQEPAVSLIICPSSLVYNWYSEMERFAPELSVLPVTGTAVQRREKLMHCREYDVLITSYDMLKRDVDLYNSLSFRYQIIDEAQFIKNHHTMAARAVEQIHSVTRFALTGTPIENRLSELWSIFNYLMPGFLYPYSFFRSEIEQPIVESNDSLAATRLKQLVHPFILRRLKTDVLKELPEKLESAVYAQMTEEQRRIYDANALQLQRSLEEQSDAAFNTGKLQILAELTKLRQLCCDPSLVYDNYGGGSAKLDTCIQLIRNAMAGGHRLLLFSQFTSMLDIIEKRLMEENILYYRLDGQTKADQRALLVTRFNENTVPVFLISLKAGGTGLNLTGADMVIHYDPWWNMAAQNQATDRTHRIGQTRTVTVYKLIARHTIEEKILQLQESKQALADQIISGEGISASSLTKEDLLNILQ